MGIGLGVVETMSKAIGNDGNVEDADVRGKTALIVAAENGDLEAVRRLLQHGADIDKRDGEGNGAIYYALLGNHVEVARELIDRGATVENNHDRGYALLSCAFNRKSLDWNTNSRPAAATPPARPAAGVGTAWCGGLVRSRRRG